MPSSSLYRIHDQAVEDFVTVQSVRQGTVRDYVRVNQLFKLNTNDMTLHLVQLLCRLWNYRDFIVDP